jgi:hypothetical protein
MIDDKTARGGGTVISLAEVRAARSAKPGGPRRDWRAGGLLAAGLVAALVIAQAFWTQQTGPVSVRAGRLVASGDLGRALDTQLSGAGSALRVRFTYRDRTGAICRSFAGTLAGVACREDGRWALKALFPGQSEPGAYRMALSGDTFSGAQERAARARHWAPSPR